jgi:hypothetical protein
MAALSGPKKGTSKSRGLIYKCILIPASSYLHYNFLMYSACYTCCRADMAALSGPKKGTSKSRQLKTFQVDLAYPQPTSSSSSSSSKVSAGAGSAASPAASPVKGGVAGRTDSPALGGAHVI